MSSTTKKDGTYVEGQILYEGELSYKELISKFPFLKNRLKSAKFIGSSKISYYICKNEYNYYYQCILNNKYISNGILNCGDLTNI